MAKPNKQKTRQPKPRKPDGAPKPAAAAPAPGRPTEQPAFWFGFEVALDCTYIDRPAATFGHYDMCQVPRL